MTRPGALDPRAWLLWGTAAILPALLGRNPFALAATLVAVLGVRAAWAETAAGNPRLASWASLARLASIFAAIGALFNLLTVPVGDRVLVEIPAGIPIVGDVLTLNALVYGLLSGLALVVLVLVGTTLGAVLDWAALLRLLPDRLTNLAVAGTVAFVFVPQTTIAFREIREAQAARGFRFRGPRDLVPILVPLLAGGLERAVTLAEALEARAFGAPRPDSASAAGWRNIAIALGLASGVTGGYLLATGASRSALIALIGGGVALTAAALDRRGGRVRRTRYRSADWGRSESIVACASLLAIGAVVAAASRMPEALRYEPYPRLGLPAADPLLLIGLGVLLVPAWVSPTADEQPSRVTPNRTSPERTNG